MTYKFVTREDLQIDWEKAPEVMPLWASKVFDKANRLLAEREAYPQAAINLWKKKGLVQTWSKEELDAEAARLLEGKK